MSNRDPITILSDAYPECREFWETIGDVTLEKRASMSVTQAVLRVVIGLMLSTKSARTIHQRVVEMAKNQGMEDPIFLDERSLRKCGLSKGKCRTIIEFRQSYQRDPTKIENWCNLDSESLVGEVRSYWGMSDWTASILCLFYFGHEDVFPKGDVSLTKSLDRLEKRFAIQLDPDRCKPYRSYLALALWKGLDSGQLQFD